VTSSTTTEEGIPVLADDPFSPEILTDPDGFHERLREAGPVARLSTYAVWAAGRFDEVHAALSDWETFISSAGVGLTDFRKEKPWRVPSLLLEADPPAHTPRRQLMTRILSPRALRSLRQQFEREADDLVR
jgi:cytochrome P450